jgi:hypothetical protein
MPTLSMTPDWGKSACDRLCARGPLLIAFTLSALPCQFSTIESLPQAPIVQLTMRSFIGNQQNTRDAEGTPALA